MDHQEKYNIFIHTNVYLILTRKYVDKKRCNMKENNSEGYRINVMTKYWTKGCLSDCTNT